MFEAGMVVAVIIALGQLLKQYINGKYIPIITLVLGILGGFFVMAHSTPQEAIINGIIAALSANGLFDVTKSMHSINLIAPTQQ